MKIAFLIASTSNGLCYKNIKETFIIQRLLKSLNKTLTSNEYNFYFGFDNDDQFFIKNKNYLEEEFNKVIKGNFHLHFINNPNKSPCLVWNELIKIAYNDKPDYFFQLGDDIVFHESDWETKLIEYFEDKNFGVFGPLDKTVPNILTCAIVPKIHFEMFGRLYPKIFKNWYSDNWLQKVYEHFKCSKIEESFNIENTGGKQRYNIDFEAVNFLQSEIQKGIKIVLQNKLNKKRMNY